MRRLYSTALAFSLLSSATIFAQGQWEPDGAQFTSPQHLLTSDDIPGVLQLIESDAMSGSIYERLWFEYSTLLPPLSTESDAARRLNAMLAKNLGFILALGIGRSQCQTFPIDETTRDTLSARFLVALSQVNDNVNDGTNPDELVRRARELSDYIAAIDIAPYVLSILPDDPRLSAASEKIRLLAGNLYQAVGVSVTSIGQPIYPIADLHDHRGLVICGALGSAALYFHDHGDRDSTHHPARWMSLALAWNDTFLWQSPDRLTEPDRLAGFAEGPHYMREAYTSLLPFYRTLGRVLESDSIETLFAGSTRSVRHPMTDPRQENLYRWIVGILDPHGTLPSIEETYVGEAFLELALTGKQEFLRPRIFEETTCDDYQWSIALTFSSVDMRSDYLAAATTPAPNTTEQFNTYFPHAGNIVLRSDRRPKGWAIGVLAESGRPRIAGGERDQGDAGSIYVIQGDQPLAYDPGHTIGPGPSADFGSARQHSMVLIDEKGPSAGDSGKSRDADATVEAYFALDRPFGGPQDRANPISYTRISTSYEGADITRHVVMINGLYGVVADNVVSEDPHYYTWQLHGFMPHPVWDTIMGDFVLDSVNREAEWTVDEFAFSAHVAVRGDSLAYLTREYGHGANYRSGGLHNTLTVKTTHPTNSMQFVAGIAPEEIENDLMYDSQDGISGATLVSRVTGRHDLFSLGQDTSFRTVTDFEADLPYDLETDAAFIGGHFSPFNETPTYLLMCQGTALIAERMPFITTDRRMDVAIFNNIDDRWEEYPAGVGYVSDSGTVWISEYALFRPEEIQGDNVVSVVPLFGSGRFRITFDGPGYFWWDHSSGVEDADKRDEEREISSVLREDDEIVVELTDETLEKRELGLIGSDGKVLARIILSSGERVVRIGLADVPSGQYFLVVLQEGRTTDLEKVVLQK